MREPGLIVRGQKIPLGLQDPGAWGDLVSDATRPTR
jgi:hypothetical protein